MASGKLRNFPAARLKEEIALHDGKLFNQAEEQSNINKTTAEGRSSTELRSRLGLQQSLTFANVV